MKQYYRNEYLFSEIYLMEITEIAEDPGVIAKLSTLKENREYAKTANLQEWNKSFTHEVLKALQFGVRIEDENVALLHQVGSPDEIISLCYCLLPSEDLDNTLMGRNWSEKIIRNLRKNNLRWGILTNGETWRIYHTEEPTPYENYLEIDLAGIIYSEDVNQFQIFNKFMKAENFLVNNTTCQFDVFKEESQKKINYIEEELRNALEQKEEGGKGILANLCMGYIEYLRKKKKPDFSDDKLRGIIYSGAMLYMFRLLFLFYAEARDLLADTDKELFASILKTAKKKQEQGSFDKDSYNLWEQLRIIFSNIDLTYNGGLFNPDENKFVEDNKISDLHQVPVLYYMTYYKNEAGEMQTISYRDMSVRHLGSLYEGLLEHKLFIAEEDTEVRLSDKEIKFIPKSEGGKIIQGKYIPKGYVYFGNDKGERKATGAYYTPEYIVEYIVSNTVGKKLKELRGEFVKDNKGTIATLLTAINKSEKDSLTDLLTTKLREFIQYKILKFSVLDPAMGSGHFLVNATNQITNQLIEFYNQFDITTNDDTSSWLWRRRLVENSIYGVDINPLAVELAKLSLWILSMAKDQALSFLNHHLKQGNSLMGTSLNKLGHLYEKKQKTLFDRSDDFRKTVQDVLQKYRKIEDCDSKSRDNIDSKKTWLYEIEESLRPYKRLCDFHTATVLEGNISEHEYNDTIKSFSAKTYTWNGPFFFHWDIEFIEIVLRNGGFDVVIGNPPYGGRYSKSEKNYFINNYRTATTIKNIQIGSLDTFTLFIEKGFDCLKKDGCLMFIVPIAITSSDSMTGVHKMIEENCNTIKISSYAVRPQPVFPNAVVNTSILFFEKTLSPTQQILCTKMHRKSKELTLEELFSKLEFIDIKDLKLRGRYPKIGTPIEKNILIKLFSASTSISSLVQKKGKPIYYRTTGGRYYKIVTNYSTGSTKETFLFFDEKLADSIGAILSSNLFFWFYQIFSNNLDLKSYEVESFKVPLDKLNLIIIKQIEAIYHVYLEDIEKNANIRQTQRYANIDSFKEYKIGKSKNIIDQIDEIICPLYGLSKEETEFIKNYEIKYRLSNEKE